MWKSPKSSNHLKLEIEITKDQWNILWVSGAKVKSTIWAFLEMSKDITRMQAIND
jgi:ribosomal 50S subunit-associated protein YjgA (DUF615 family)